MNSLKLQCGLLASLFGSMLISLLIIILMVSCETSGVSSEMTARMKYLNADYPLKCKRLKDKTIFYAPQRSANKYWESYSNRYICKDVDICYLLIFIGRGGTAIPVPNERCKEF